MKRVLKKTVYIFLAALILFGSLAESIIPAYALSVEDEKAPNGQTWEEAYPNGAFIFKESYLHTREGDDKTSIIVYRMGGRNGKAIARLAITPVTPEGNMANAAGFNDFEICSPEDVQYSDTEYETAFVNLVFEDEEYMKSLDIQAINDELSEPEELFIVTIYDAEGAEFIEDANRFTACIQDDDPYIESCVFLNTKEMTFDKSSGTATLELKRTGGTQYVFSVDYDTASDSAVQGVDFAPTSGTLLFNCGEETAIIEIPLINDNIKSPEADISFTLKLSNPKGGYIREGSEEAAVYLYNSAMQDAVMNIATLVTDSGAVDISAQAVVSSDAVTANKEGISVVPKVKQLVQQTEDPSGGQMMLKSIVADNWKPKQGDWKTYTMLANDKDKFGFGNYYNNSDDAYADYFESASEWHTLSSAPPYHPNKGDISFGFEYDDEETRVWKVWDSGANDPYGYAIMKQADLDGLWEFYKSISSHVSMQLSAAYVAGSSPNEAAFLLSRVDTPYASLSDATTGDIDNVIDNSLILAKHVGQGRQEYSIFDVSMTGLLKNTLEYVNFDRFVMAVRDHCWEDNLIFRNWVDDFYLERSAINNLQYEVVCKDGDGYLEANNNMILKQIMPQISFSDNDGGTDASGNLYIGSRLKLDAPPTAGAFQISRVELRKKEGSNWRTINTGKLNENKKTGYIDLRSGSESKVQRVQDMSSITAETAEYSLYVEMERKQEIRIDYSPSVLPRAADETDQSYLQRVKQQGDSIGYPRGFNMSTIGLDNSGQATNTYCYKTFADLTTLDFNLTNGEAIIYDGTLYYGPVPIKLEHYLNERINLLFYDSDSMGRQQEVRISGVESVRMYRDENGNGEVDEGNDTFLGFINDDRYLNNFFAPEIGKDGQMKQKLIKYDYVKVPRKVILSPFDDPNLRYSMKAYFMTSSVSDVELERFTSEMKSFRQIKTRDQSVPVYGVEATKGSITVPLGGDYSPPVFDEHTKKWSWDPNFMGNLKDNFSDPAAIREYATVAGNKDIPHPTQTNNYLGSFRNTDQLILHLLNEHESIIDQYYSFCTYRDIVLGDFSQNQDLDFSVPEGGDNDEVEDTPGAEEPQMDLPDINIPAGPFKVILEGDRAGFELGIPLFGGGNQKESEKDTGLLGKNRSKYLNDMKDALGKGDPSKGNIFDQLKKASKKATDGLKPKADVDVSFMFGFSASFMWKYSQIDAQWHFDEARIFVTFNGEVKISQRLPPVPIIYVYIIFSADVEIGLNINIDETIDNEGLRSSEVKFSGEISLELGVEAGVGIGVDLAKFEIFLKVNIGLVIKLAEEFSGVDEFSIGAAIGFRAVFLFLTFEMDAISFKFTYEHNNEPDPWKFEWAVFGQDQPVQQLSLMSTTEDGDKTLNQPPKTRLRMSGRTSDKQIITGSGGGIMLKSIPTVHGFELGEYNEGASANMLVDNLRYSADYRLFEVNGKNYIFYLIDGGLPRSSVDADMLVLSSVNGGLSDPASLGGNYTVVDMVYGAPDLKGDSAFDVDVDDSKIKTVWIDYQKATSDDPSAHPQAVMLDSSRNTQLKYSVYDSVYLSQGFNDAIILGTPDGRFDYLPKITTTGGRSVVASVKSWPYTEAELADKLSLYKHQLIADLEAVDEDDAKSKYPYYDFKVGNFHNMNILYGKYSTLCFGVETGSGFVTTEVEPTSDWKNKGTRIEQMEIYDINDETFYLAYVTSYNYLDNLTNMTAKRLYLRKGTINADGSIVFDTPLLLRTLVDSEDDKLDGIYTSGNGNLSLEESFIDPFFSGLEFAHGKLHPSGQPENMLIFNMNNRYYVIDENNLDGLINNYTGIIMPFFELNDNYAGDSKADFSIGVDGDGNISAVYTSPVSYTNNNAIFLTKYDPYSETWGEGIMLAMRDMGIYEQSIDEGWSGERTEAEYYNSPNGNAKLIFQKPRVVVGEAGSLLIVTQTAMTELEEVNNPFYDQTNDPKSKEKIKIPKRDNNGYTLDTLRGFYSLSFPVGGRTISSPSLLFDNNAFVPGSVLIPRVSFKNVGDFALRGSEEKPLKIQLVLGDEKGVQVTKLAEWSVPNHIPSGDSVDTLLNSEDSVYGQIGTQIPAEPLPDELNNKYLYFRVLEDSGWSNSFSYSSLDVKNPQMEGISYYSTNQDKAELVLEGVTLKQGGDIITIDEVRYVPLDVTANVKNYGQVTAEDTTLSVEYRKTDAVSGKKSYIPVVEAGINGVVDLGPIAAGQGESYITNNSDYEKDGNGSYIIQTDGSLIPFKANDLLVPLAYFDDNAPGIDMELRFTATSTTDEFDLANNIVYTSLAPIGSIKISGPVYLVPNRETSFEVNVESSSLEPLTEGSFRLTEITAPDKASLLKPTMSYNAQAKTITIEAESEGETILRVVDTRTASFADVIVTSVASLPSAPCITRTEPRDASAFIWYDPPEDSGGVPVSGYMIEAHNIIDQSEIITRNFSTAGRYEFVGLTNDQTYRFRCAAMNSAGTGPWSNWSANVKPAGSPPGGGQYDPMDAAIPVINTQNADINVELGSNASLEIEATVSDGGIITYQWYSNNTNSTNGGNLIEGATSSAYSPSTADAGVSYYYCVITNTNINAVDKKTAEITGAVAAVAVAKGVPSIIFNANKSDGSTYDETVVLTAEIVGVEGTTPTGTVRFESSWVLADLIPLTDGKASYDWEDAQAGEHRLRAIYYGDDNYEEAEGFIDAYSISKATPAIIKQPVTDVVKKGTRFSEIVLKDGEANIPGTFAWVYPDNVIDAAGDFPVIFTPVDTANYNQITMSIPVQVESIDVVPDVPDVPNDPYVPDNDEQSIPKDYLDVGNINWNVNPVIIDVSSINRISTAVFEYISRNYTGKEIIIRGKGYTITFAAGSITEIPETDYIDFGMIFKDSEMTDGTPVQSSIFNHRGKLPGDAKISFDIGKEHLNQTMVISIPDIDGISSYTLELPPDSLSGLDEISSLTLSTGIGRITIADNMLTGLAEASGKKIGVTIGEGDKSNLPENIKKAIGDRPLVQLTLTLDGEKTDWNNPKAPVTVSIPYTPTAEELTDPEHIVVWYIDGGGNVVSVPNGRYDSETGMVTFTTTHFSYYAITFFHKTFGDLGCVEWARKPIEVMASKGIIKGTSESTYSPVANITRADYLLLLVRTLGLTTDFDPVIDGNFDDVEPGTYYYETIGIAKKLGITTGVGGNRFNPREPISRQDMMVLTARALERFRNMETKVDISVLSKFIDKGDIAPYAKDSLATMVKRGLILGDGQNRLNPKGQTTRAEAAMFLYRIYSTEE